MKHVILFLAASPRGPDQVLGRLASDREARAIDAELERGDQGACFELRTHWAAEPRDLLHTLRKLKPTVVHFSGHGGGVSPGEQPAGYAPQRDIAERVPQPGLFFQDGDGNAQFIPEPALVETFSAAGASVSLVVLNACYSAELAMGLLAHVDCVVGMRGSIGDDAAREFAIGFYGGLAQGETVHAAWKQGRAAIRLTGVCDADLPQLEVRAGVDARRYILAPYGSGPMSVGEPRPSTARLPQLTAALADAFKGRIEELREVAMRYDRQRLPMRLPGDAASVEDIAWSLVWSSYGIDGSVLESVIRSARRMRPQHEALAQVVSETWQFAGGLDFARVDDLRARLHAAGVAMTRLRDATQQVLGAEQPPLWIPIGAEAFDDLIEGLAQLPGRPPKLVRVMQQLRDVPGVAEWIRSVAPSTPDMVTTAGHKERLRLLLRHGANNTYTGEVYLLAPDGLLRFVTEFRDPVPLVDIPARFAVARAQDEALRRALFRRSLGMVEIVLPVEKLLTDVERWNLFGSGSIGARYPVVVRPLERMFAMQHPDYLGGSMLLDDSREMLRRAPAIQTIALELEQVNAALQDHLRRWCVAAFRCPDALCGDRLAALDALVKCGVAAMLAVRHDHAWPDLRADHALPRSVHDHRRDHLEHPVTLLWDDMDFIPENAT